MLTTIPAYLCITGANPRLFSDFASQDSLNSLNSFFFDKIYPGRLRYQFRIVYKDTIQECEQMRDEHLAKQHESEQHEWSPVFIYDWSDETLFDRLKISALEFDNNQQHMHRVCNHGTDRTEIEMQQGTAAMRKRLENRYDNLQFDYTFDLWPNSLNSKMVITELNNNLAKQEWEFYTSGEDIAEKMMDHLCLDGLSVDSIQSFLHVFSDDSISSKLVFAFNTRLHSGVLFIGDIHEYHPMLQLEVSVIQAMMPWLHTVFTEFPTAYFTRKQGTPFMIALNDLSSQRPSNEKLIVCPLRDSGVFHYTELSLRDNFPFINGDTLYELRRQKMAGLPKKKHLSLDTVKRETMNGIDFNDDKSIKDWRWRVQYKCSFSPASLTALIRSMLHFNSLNHPRLKPNSLNIAIIGAGHLVDIMDAVKGRLTEDLVSNLENIPDDLWDLQSAQ